MFENKDFDSIMEEMLASVSDKLDKREGSIIYDAIAPIAMELAQTYIDMDMIVNEVYADTASYYYLIKRAAENGVYPKEETNAVCKMVVSPSDTAIAIGDRFNLGDLNYEVTSVMDAATGEYQVTCETAGIVGNQQLGSLLTIETKNDLNDMETAELTEVLIPGEDEEDVEDFRERYYEGFSNTSFCGNNPDYKERVSAIDGVGACKVIRMWEKGYDPVKFIPVAAVTEWIGKQSAETVGAEVFAWLKAVHDAAKDKLLTVGGTVRVYIISSEFKAPSATLVQKVQNDVDPDDKTGEGYGLAPIGHVVKVMGVKEVPVAVTVTAVYKNGYSFESLKSDMQLAIDGYFTELSADWSNEDNLVVRKSQIESRLLLIDGILDITDVKLKGASENVTLDEDAIPVRGDVSG